MSDRTVLYDIARLLALARSESGDIIIATTADQDSLIPELTEELHVQADARVRVIEPESVALLREQLASAGSDVVLLKGLEGWSNEELRALDINRVIIEARAPVVFWLRHATVARLFQQAPNVRSLIGGRVFEVDPDLGLITEEEKRQRLLELSQRHHLEDSEIIRRAEIGKLSSHPDFVEWLILLGRRDLAKQS